MDQEKAEDGADGTNGTLAALSSQLHPNLRSKFRSKTALLTTALRPVTSKEKVSTETLLSPDRFQEADPVQVATDGQMAIDYLAGTGPFSNRERHPLPGLVLLDLK